MAQVRHELSRNPGVRLPVAFTTEAVETSKTAVAPFETISEPAIAALVDRFYAKARRDPVIGPVFNNAVHEWDEHLRKLCDFWSSVMLTSGRYKGNPMAAHMKHPIEPGFFDRWLSLWRETAGELFAPPQAAHFRAKAERIAESLKLGLFFRPEQGKANINYDTIVDRFSQLVDPSRPAGRSPAKTVAQLGQAHAPAVLGCPLPYGSLGGPVIKRISTEDVWRRLDARKIDATHTLYEIFYYEEPAVTAGQLRRGLLETRLPSWSAEERAAALLAVADLISDEVTFFAPRKRGLDDHSHSVQLISALRAAAAER